MFCQLQREFQSPAQRGRFSLSLRQLPVEEEGTKKSVQSISLEPKATKLLGWIGNWNAYYDLGPDLAFSFLQIGLIMKKHLLALGTLLTTISLLGCSGTPENSAGPISSQPENSLSAGSTTSDSAGQNAAPADAQIVRIGSINWYVNYDQALAAAKQTGRPVWLHFGENPG